MSSVRTPVPVGKYFLDRGKITSLQLDLALKHKVEFGLKLGQSLVELGLVSESDMVQALRHQARFPCINLTPGIVENRVAHKVGAELSRRLGAVALNQVAGHTTVALEDPNDLSALEELSHVLATRIFPVYAKPSSILRMIEHVFGSGKRNRGQAKGPVPLSSTQVRARLQVPAAAAATAAATAAAPVGPAAAARPGEEAVPGEAPPDERAVVDRVRSSLQEAFARGVSVVHLEAQRDGLRVRFRTEGELSEHVRLPRSWTRPTVACLKALAKIENSDTVAPREGAIPFLFNKQQLLVRIRTTPSRHGESAVLHINRSEAAHQDLGGIGLLEQQRTQLTDILAEGRGLIVIGGPIGSGRRTTMQAMLAHLVTPETKIAMLTESTASEVEGVLHVHVDPRAGFDHPRAVRALLGQDPDYFAVAELEGREAAESVLEGTLAGRGAMACMRSNGALDALRRLLEYGLESYLIADSLRAIVGQRLVRAVCPDCKAPTVPDEVLTQRLELDDDGTVYFEGEGCEACKQRGYRGRVALYEVLTLTPRLRRAIEKGESHDALVELALAEGFSPLRRHGLELARNGSTTLHEVLAATTRG